MDAAAAPSPEGKRGPARLARACPWRARKVRASHPGASWTFLGTRAGLLRRLLEVMPRESYRAANGHLQARAAVSQAAYVEAVAALGRGREEDLGWWADGFSEANPEVSSSFHALCQVLAADDLKEDGVEVFFVEDDAVRSVLDERWGGSAGRLCGCPSRSIRLVVTGLLHRMLFLWTWTTDALASRSFRSAAGGPATLLFTWADGRSLGPDGKFRDLFLGDLADRLRTKGLRVVTVPRLMPGAPRARLRAAMAREEGKFLPLAGSLRCRDVFRRWIGSFRGAPRAGGGAVEVLGVPMEKIFKADAARRWRYPRSAENLLYHDAVLGWKRLGLRVERFIYPYENHGWEKVSLAALRRDFPGAAAVGYQHARLPRVLPNYYVAPREAAPKPDAVVSMGPLYRERLVEAGYDPARTLAGPSLRYGGLSVHRRDKPPSVPLTVLAAFSIGGAEAREFLDALLEAFSGRAGVRVLLKFHPDLPAWKVLRGGPPEPFTVEKRPLGELLAESDLFLYTTTTACLEAVAAGVPAGHYEIFSGVDGDPLDVAPDLRASCGSPAALRELADRRAAGELHVPETTWVEYLMKRLFGGAADAAPFLAERRHP